MLTVQILCVGSLKERYWKEACEEYQKRLSAFCKLEIVEIPEFRLSERPSPAQIDQALEAEGDKILAKAKGILVPLCIEGKQLDSPGLSRRLTEWAVQGNSEIGFVIGGSHGLSAKVKQRAALALSMSEMTFPHQLARVMLLEQIYRAFMIQSNAKYHK